MTDLRFMPIYWGDFLADTSHLSGLQSGSYLLLLGQMWLRGGWVPDDDEQLARMCRLSLPEWLEVRPLVRPFLMARRGKLSQKRLLCVHKSASETHQKTVEKTTKMRQAKRNKKQQDAATKEDIARARPDMGTTDTTVSVETYNGASHLSARKRASKPKNSMIEEVKRRMAAAKEDDYGDGYFILPPAGHH